jgi:hypothetical protein
MRTSILTSLTLILVTALTACVSTSFIDCRMGGASVQCSFPDRALSLSGGSIGSGYASLNPRNMTQSQKPSA